MVFSFLLSMTTRLAVGDHPVAGRRFIVEADLAGALDVELAAGLLAARAELHELAGHGADAGEMVGDLLRGFGRRGLRRGDRSGAPGKCDRATAQSGEAKEAAPRGAESWSGCVKRFVMPVITLRRQSFVVVSGTDR